MAKRRRFVSNVLIVVMAVLNISGCAPHNEIIVDETQVEASAGIDITIIESEELLQYSANAIPFPVELDVISVASKWGDLLVVSGRASENEQGFRVCVMDLAGNMLSSYKIGNKNELVEDVFGTPDGVLWVMTTIYEEGEDEVERYFGSNIYKISLEGQISAPVELRTLPTAPLSLKVDHKRECVYLATDGVFYVFDYDGEEIFRINTTIAIDNYALTADGELAVIEEENEKSYIRILDYDKQQLAERHAVDIGFIRLFEGGVADLYCSDGSTLYEIDCEKWAALPILDWVSAGVGSNVLDVFAENGEFIYVGNRNIYILSVDDQPKEMIELKLATFSPWLIEQDVLRFNESQDAYKIVVEDYSVYNTLDENYGGIAQLNLDIATNDAPDIYDLKSIPVSQFAQLGLLADLYPFINEDAEIKREDLNSVLLEAMETGGELYSIIPHCMILTMLGDNRSFSNELNTVEQLLSIADGDDPFGGSLSRYDFIRYMLAGNDSPFINWENMQCTFNCVEFIDLLHIASQLPAEAEGFDSQKIRTGEQRLAVDYISEFGGIIYYSYMFGDSEEDVVTATGMPGKGTSRVMVYPARYSWGISALSENKDGAWQFIRTFLVDEYQKKGMIPLSLSALESSRVDYESWISQGGVFNMVDSGGEVVLTIGSEIYFQALEELISKTTGMYDEDLFLMEIVWSEAQAFFAGDRTAEEVANAIQSRATIYLNEKS